MKIKDLNRLAESILRNGAKFVSAECETLLPPGENYGSVMLRVVIKVLDAKSEEKIIHCVAKTVPPTDFLWEVFNTKVTFKREIAVYKSIVPILNEFGAENGIDNLMDFFAEYLGARISLDSRSDVVDGDAILLLENLKMKGYDVMDRYNGLDLECTKLLLKNMAVMHAASIGYKLAKPDGFKVEIFPYLKRATTFVPNKDFLEAVLKASLEACRGNPSCIPYLSKIENALDIKTVSPLIIAEPFATFLHNDLWINNVMIKMINGQAQRAVIVDFQSIEYGSPAHDLIFFLYSSASLSILKHNVDFLIEYYYDALIGTLKKLGCDLDRFHKADLIEQCGIATKTREFAHLLMMFNIIFTLKDKAKSLVDLNGQGVPFLEGWQHENYYRRVPFVLLDLAKRGWI